MAENISFPNKERKIDIYKENISKENPISFTKIIAIKNNISNLESKSAGRILENELSKLIISTSHENKNEIYYNRNLFNLSSIGNSFTLQAGADVVISADNIAEFAYPLVQFIEQEKPDYIVCCDRGARVFGMAIKMMYRQMFGALPTIDGLMYFRKITRKLPYSDVEAKMKDLLSQIQSKARGKRLKVLVVDDWVSTGGTQEVVKRLFVGMNIDLKFGVIRGTKADISGKLDSRLMTAWTDDSEQIGVEYTDGVSPLPVKKRWGTPLHVMLRQQIRANISVYLKGIRMEKRGVNQY